MLITFEGGEAVGKSTQIARLAGALTRAGRTVVTTREPGGSPLGDALRALLLDPARTGMSTACEALLYAAARAEHIGTLILPALERGEVVLCDRYLDSSMAYQGYGRGLGADWVRSINAPARSALPARTYLLSMSPERALARRRGGLDRIEREGAEFHARVHEGFLDLARAEPERFLVLDASRSIDVLAEEIARDALALLS